MTIERQELLRAARAGYSAKIQEYAEAIHDIDVELSGKAQGTRRSWAGQRKAAKRNVSAAGRKAIGDAARKRWAQYRKQNQKTMAAG